MSSASGSSAHSACVHCAGHRVFVVVVVVVVVVGDVAGVVVGVVVVVVGAAVVVDCATAVCPPASARTAAA